MDALPANRSWQPPCSHGMYQHEAITSRSRQLPMMGTWLPETCWATIRRERIQKVTSSWFFLSTLMPAVYYRTLYCSGKKGKSDCCVCVWMHTHKHTHIYTYHWMGTLTLIFGWQPQCTLYTDYATGRKTEKTWLASQLGQGTFFSEMPR